MTDDLAGFAAASDAPPPLRRRGVRWVVAVVLLLVLVGGAIVAELSVRSFVENAVAAGVRQQLPEGVDGDVEVRFGGTSVIVQLLTGELDDVTLTSDDLTVGGIPVSADVVATGVPVSFSGVDGPIRELTGTITLPQESVASLLRQQGVDGDITLHGGALVYARQIELLGQQIGFEIRTTPSLDGGRIVFSPESATVEGGRIQYDATELLNLVVPNGLAVCVAQYIPAAVSLESVSIEGTDAVVDLGAQNLDPATADLRTPGACS